MVECNRNRIGNAYVFGMIFALSARVECESKMIA